MAKLVCHPAAVMQQVQRGFQRSRIDYADYYIRLYIAYNAWYQSVAHTLNDRQALTYLKSQTFLWDEYRQGRALGSLHHPMALLAELTQREPLFEKLPYWSGSLDDPYDWPSLVEYWYQVRCALVHGSEVAPEYVQLAYHTLYEFMAEIICRAMRYTACV